MKKEKKKKVLVPKCAKGHEMVVLTKAPYEGFDYVTCDKCSKMTYGSGGIIHCRECEVDYCIDCAKEIFIDQKKKVINYLTPEELDGYEY